MGVFFRSLLTSRNIRFSETEKFLPLWKLKLSDVEIQELVTCIRVNKDSAILQNYALEIILLYAVWWRTRYRGGAHSWETALYGMGICSEQEARDVYKPRFAKIVKFEFEESLLNLTLYRSRDGKRRFLESSLVQGGFPIRALRELKNSNSGFQSYLQCLFDRYKDFPISDPKWEDSSIAEALAVRFLNNRSFQNESFYEVCLEIIKSVCFPTEFSFDPEQDDYIRDILIGLPKKHTQHFFSIEWKFQRHGDRIDLLFKLLCPDNIQANTESADSPIESYYINNQCIATYQNCHRVSYLSKPQEWNINKGAIRLWREYLVRKDPFSEGESRIEPFSGLRNSTIPDLSLPLFLQEDGVYWKKRGRSSFGAQVCLFPDCWKCVSLPDSEVVYIAGQKYHWALYDWNSIDSEELKFKNIVSGDEFCFPRIESNYEACLNVFYPDWVDSVIGGKAIIINPVTRSLFSIYNAETSVPPLGKSVILEYKTTDQRDYQPLRAESQIPSGQIEVQITLPDKTKERFSFFSINGIEYTPLSETRFSFKWNDGVIRLEDTQNSHYSECGNNVFELSGQDALADKNPACIKCISYADGSNVVFKVKSPSTKPGIYDSAGQRLRSRFISINDLYKYRFCIEPKHTLALTCVCNGEVKMTSSFKRLKGEYPLEYLRKYVDKYNVLFSFEGADAYLEMSIKESGTVLVYVRIRMHSFLVNEYQGEQEDEKGVIVLSDSNNPVSGLNLGLVVPDEPEDSMLSRRVIPLVEKESLGVYFPEEAVDGKDYIVFAMDTDIQVLPTMIYASSSPKEYQRERNKEDNLKLHAELLTELDNTALWQDILFYLDTVIDHHLPFQTFNCFTAMKSLPEALFELCVRASRRRRGRDIESLVDEFLRYETEMGFSFHYIPSSIVLKRSEEHTKRLADGGYDNDEIKQLQEKEFGLYYGILTRKFKDSAALLYLKSFKNVFPADGMRYQSISDYLSKCNQTYYESETDTNPFMFQPRAIDSRIFQQFTLLDPNVTLSGSTRNRIIKMRYFCIVAPQLAAYAYLNKGDLDLWRDDSDGIMPFMRRMINFVAAYAPEAYGDIFITTVGKQLTE